MDEDSELIRYLCRVIDDGHSSIGLKWGKVIGVLSTALGAGEDAIEGLLEETGIGYRGNRNAEFLVHGVYDASVSKERGEEAFSRLLEHIGNNPDLANLLIMVATEYGLTIDLVDFLLYDASQVPLPLMDNPYVALETSDHFLESASVNGFVKKAASGLRDQMDKVLDLTAESWFLNLMEIIRPWNPGLRKDGSNVFSDKDSSNPDQKQLYELVTEGFLPWVMLNRNRVLKEKPVMEAFRRKRQADSREGHLMKFYYWLGIANDFVLGVLFLAGSFEFLPNGNEVAGVIMFIIGSAQLVGRSVIKIVMNLHIKSRRKKIGSS